MYNNLGLRMDNLNKKVATNPEIMYNIQCCGFICDEVEGC